MTLHHRLKSLNDRINALSLRERGLMLLAVLAVVVLVWDTVMMRPVDQRYESAQKQLELVQGRVEQVSQSIQRLVAQRQRDPEAELRERRESLESENQEIRESVASLHGGVSSPRLAVDMLERLLADRPGLELVTLENLPAERLMSMDLQGGAGLGGIFVHRVRLVVETDFPGVLEYMGLIEQLPEGVYWESMKLEVPDWPTNRVEMVLYTLALEDGWIGV